MKDNHLTLNDFRTEVVAIGTHLSIKKLDHTNSIMMRNQSAEISTSAKNIGVVIDQTLSRNKHINSATKTGCFHLLRLVRLGHI